MSCVQVGLLRQGEKWKQKVGMSGVLNPSGKKKPRLKNITGSRSILPTFNVRLVENLGVSSISAEAHLRKDEKKLRESGKNGIGPFL